MVSPISQASVGMVCVIRASVLETPKEQRISGGRTLYKTTVTDGTHDVQLTFFNNRYIPVLLKKDAVFLFRGRMDGTLLQRKMLSPDFIPESKAIPFRPIYPLTSGLTSRAIQHAIGQAIHLLRDCSADPLGSALCAEYELCSFVQAIRWIHQPSTHEDILKARKRLVFEEFLVLQLGLIGAKAATRKRNANRIAPSFPDDFTARFPYHLTGAQKRAICEALADMAGDGCMNRLVQGDVGSGKTAVAAALCWKIAQSGRQAALMAPTEILALQHHKTFSSLLADSGIRVELLTGSLKKSAKSAIYAGLEDGSIPLVIGTHALISTDVHFKQLGLVITDEQHRFGVAQRQLLAEKGEQPHTLVMSATPIPRTLALMVYGDLDVSVLDELPPGRKKVETYLIDSQKRRRAFRYVQKHLDEGFQGYIICPMIENTGSELASVTEYSKLVHAFFPHANIGVLHGQMKNTEKEDSLRTFASGETDLLIATTVVEVGVDVPNAVIMLIENAERYGLSQLHQLRGRIGRGSQRATCILISDTQQEETLRRLHVLCQTNDGFRISEEDLKSRGPGDFFGARQHGLPKLKIADMMNDMQLLMQAQNCAARLLESGAYQSGSYELLAEEVHLLFSSTRDALVP